MVFSSFEFIFLFFPVVYFLFQRVTDAQKLWVLVASTFVFYSRWSPKYSFLFFSSIVVNYLLARYLLGNKSKKVLSFGIVLNLLPLIYFKYSKFFLTELSVAPEIVRRLSGHVLPLGISFFSFQQMTYLIDIYRGIRPIHSVRNYFFYVAFFPHLIAGPILHHEDIIPQTQTYLSEAMKKLKGLGFVYFFIGLIKKIVIADSCGGIADQFYGQSPPPTGWSAAVGTLAYTFQIYYDFSGYSDMASGLAYFFGFKFPMNFDRPYLSPSLREFWRRWHMSLSRFLRDYVYISLGGSRSGLFITLRNLFLTMLIGGIWHGAGWGFLLWGAFHGIWLGIEVFLAERISFRFPKYFRVILTFCAVHFGWIFFRSTSLAQVGQVFSAYLTRGQYAYQASHWFLLIAGILIFLPSSHDWVAASRRFSEEWSDFIQRTLSRLAIFSCIGLVLTGGIASWFYSLTPKEVLAIYRKLPIRVSENAVDASRGDFRSSLLASRIVYLPHPNKTIIVGSSFTMGIPLSVFNVNGTEVMSGSAGVNGNHIVTGLRTANSLLDLHDSTIKRIVFGISPINFGSGFRDYVFKGESTEDILSFFDIELRKKGKFSGNHWLFSDYFKFPFLYWSDEYFLFRNFLGKAFEKGTPRVALPKGSITLGDVDLESRHGAEMALRGSSQPANPDNGMDQNFKWRGRGILEALSANSSEMRAIAALKKKADEQGVELVFYQSPAVSHADLPSVYPAGFYEEYRTKSAIAFAGMKVKLLDLSRFYPWDNRFMGDFIHPRDEVKHLLLYRLMKEMEKK